MPIATIDGLKVNYLTCGSGPPLLMLAPGGFEATIERWSNSGVWRTLKPLDELSRDFQLIVYDRRECGKSGGRVEPLTWRLFAAQAKGLLDHLKISRAFVLGGCMGCSVAAAFATAYPETCRGLILHWPVGGFHWRAMGRGKFDEHIEFLRTNGLAGVVERARQAGSFWQDPAGGPWASVIAGSAEFADWLGRQPPARYLGTVVASRESLFPDAMPSGVSAEELMGLTMPTLIMGGNDEVHTRSAAWTMRELIPGAEIAPTFPPEQTAEDVAMRIRGFGAAHPGGA